MSIFDNLAVVRPATGNELRRGVIDCKFYNVPEVVGATDRTTPEQFGKFWLAWGWLWCFLLCAVDATAITA